MAISLKDEDVYIFDVECNGLLDVADKIHCMSVGRVNKKGEFNVKSFTDYEDMKAFFSDKSLTLAGHNIIRFDIPVCEKILGIKIATNNIIDTLPLSWYLFSTEVIKHGLEEWGEVFGIKKPEVTNWESLSVDEYCHRCQEDVKINHKLWVEEKDYLLKLYGTEEAAIKFIKYSNFKSICVREQEEIGVRLDVKKAHETLEKLNSQIQPKLEKLSNLMPKVEVISTKKKPKQIYKKDGSYTAAYLKWEEFRVEFSVPEDYDGDEVEYVSGYEPANAGSPDQLKNWLFSLGWDPQTFKTSVSKKTGVAKEVPQIYDEKKGKGEVCDSVTLLYEKVSELQELESLGILKHRCGLIKGFIEEGLEIEEDNVRLYGSISAYTNTLRLRHRKPLVNLPKVGLPWGEEIRGCLIADEGDIMCGADLTNVESILRNHYLFPHDSDYVESLNDPLFDSHIDIAVLAGFCSEEDGLLYVKIDKDIIKPTEEEKKIFKEVKAHRSKAKNCNFGATYGIGATKLAKMSNLPVKEAKRLLEIYWERNWAIKKVASLCDVKSVNGNNWLFNPVSGFWLQLRAEKDRFSTLNQSSAVYTFDLWVMFVRKLGIKVQYQAHDEILFSIKKGDEQKTTVLLQQAMDMVNEELKLNVVVGMKPAYGPDYAACH